MGWVKTEVIPSSRIFADIISEFGEKRNGWIGNYEYFSDYIRDNYDVTLAQCDLICKMIKQHYHIQKFYATD